MFGIASTLPALTGGVLGAAAAASAVLAWAVFIHGPAQHEAGGLAKAAELTAATNAAIMELSDEADRARVRRRLCIERGGLYSFASGECREG